MQFSSRRTFTARHRILLTSTALLAIGAASEAAAQDIGVAPPEPVHALRLTEPAETLSGETEGLVHARPEAQAGTYLGRITVPAPTPQIVIANPGTSTTSRDTGVTGVGQMVVDQQNGFIGLCTGTLINVRTVIFAAHCVNDRAATAYGANSGGVPMSFGFQADNLPGLQRWFNATAGGQPNPLYHQSNPNLGIYNVNQVRYNPLSLEAAANSFLYGDVAIATLDAPASNVPTWAMLFSQLPGPATVGAGGTGYNVQIVGYGNHGNATTGGASGSDFRRRAAENMIGGLTDLQTFEQFLFGGAPNGLTQNLYFIDFDDPRRGLTGASPFDFNAFRDNARGTSEGITASGDSGGPLILQNTFNKMVLAGVLSGGYTRFFNGQPSNGYGTVSFYQPLYLYWDWIAANNPYRYASALAGDGKWSDPTHWVTNTDPSYQIIGPNGQLVNGVPTNPGEQKNGTSGDFGQICFQSGGISDCYDTRTGVETVEARPIGTEDSVGAPTSGVGEAAASAIAWQGARPEAEAQAQASSQTPQALPAATLANGLPGATNFVPNNVDPVRATGAIGRYFDVTLSAAGTTTLDTAVTIDKFTLAGAQARLNIAAGGSLTSLIDVTQAAGVLTVDGTLTTRGDYLFMGGGLMGSGRINAPYTTVAMGAIAPGTQGGIGTLTFGGNLVLASGSSVVIDLGAGSSDRIAVVANSANGSAGTAMLGGRVAFGLATGQTVRYSDVYTILTAQGGITGTFQAPAQLSAILKPTLLYRTNDVRVRIDAGSYASVVDGSSAVQRGYAQLLDQNRAQFGNYGSLYTVLDLASVGEIRSTLQSFAPEAETMKTAIATSVLDNSTRFYRGRLEALSNGEMGGTLAFSGKPVQVAALAMGSNIASDATQGYVQQGALPETMSGFVSISYVNGSGAPMRGIPGAGRDRFDGFFGAAGIEAEVGENGRIGFGVSYTDVDGKASATNRASGTLYQGTLYAQGGMGGVELDSAVSFGKLDTRTDRNVAVGGTAYFLHATDNVLAVTSEVNLSVPLEAGALTAKPGAGLRASYIGFTPTREVGGPMALAYDRGDYTSLQGRAGLSLATNSPKLRPHLSVDYVHEFRDQAGSFGANFVGGLGPDAIFALGSEDRDWAEVRGGLTIRGDNVDLGVSAGTDVFRDDVRTQSYTGSVTVRF